jgi:MFS transporter, OFA family, oxalate/formate antiporter
VIERLLDVKPKLFYGWYIVISGAVLSFVFSSIVGYGWTAFVGPMIATFGWSMAQVSLASSLRSLEIGVFNPLWGPAVDRYSPKSLMRIGVVCASLGLFILSQMHHLVMYYLGFLLAGVGSSLVTGMLPLVVISRWFRKDIGKANGLFFMGTGLGGVAVPLVVTLIDKLSWRTTLLYTAIGFFVLGLSLSFIFRSRPDDYGLEPDGKAPNKPGKSESPRAADFGTGVKEALKMRAFWHLAVVTLFQNATLSTVMLYAIPYLTNLGMTRKTAGSTIMLYTFFSLFGRVPFGMLADIFRKNYVIAFSIVLQIIGLLFYDQMSGTNPLWLILLFAIPYGFGVSGVMPLRAPILAEYFGLKNFGTIFGLTSVFIAAGNIISPPLAGWIFDTYHSYKAWWSALVVLGVLALTAVLTMPQVQERTEPEVVCQIPVFRP